MNTDWQAFANFNPASSNMEEAIRNLWGQVNAGAMNAGIGGAGLGNAAAMPVGGRQVTRELLDEMIVRRTGNICKVAAAEGWKLSRAVSEPVGVRFIFGRNGCWITGAPATVKSKAGAAAAEKQALVNAAEAVAPVLGIF